MRRDGMGRGVARLYAKRREALDQYVPMWLMPGQDGPDAGQDDFAGNPLKNKPGPDGQHGLESKTDAETNTGTHERIIGAPIEKPQGDRCSPHGPDICVVHPVHPVQASSAAAFLGQDAASPPCPSCPWTDLDAWCARLGAAGGLHARRAVLREWVAAAGGWSDAAAIHVPASLPKGLAAATLRAHGRALRLDVREDHDDPAHLRWLRGDQS